MRGLAFVVLVGLLAGCGGGSDAPDSDAARPADSDSLEDVSGCDLLTDAEVGEATAATITGHEEYSMSGCRWLAQGGMELMLDLYTGSSVIPATCGAQKVLGTGREEAVSGLGDSALWKTSGSLVVCSPRAVLRFNLDNSPRVVSEDKDAVVKLARLALDRLSE